MKVRKSNNAVLGNAKKKQDDEFYTRIEDIDNECKNYLEHFKGKAIYCPCDDPRWSKFWEYFHKNFTRFGLTKLISTFYSANPEDKPFKTVYTGGDDDNLKAGERTELKGDGNFLGEEVLEMIENECDLVVTNPPFSLLRDFLQRVTSMHKPFLLVGPLTALSLNVTIDGLRENTMHVGWNALKWFTHGDGTKTRVYCIWLTSLDTGRHETITLDMHKRFYDSNGNPFYDVEKRYPYLDGTKIIIVCELKDVPIDYMGVMAVPISYLQWWNRKQFKMYAAVRPSVNGKTKFSYIVIQRTEAVDPDQEADILHQIDIANVDKKKKTDGSGKVKTKREKVKEDDEFSLWNIQ